MSIIIVGGGPAGMMAAITAARHGAQVTLIEHKNALGLKLRLTGKGRCNLTNLSSKEAFMQEISEHQKFCHGMFHQFFVSDLMSFFESRGCKFKVERGDRVFPVSDRSSDIIEILIKELKTQKVQLLTSREILRLTHEKTRITGVLLQNGETIDGSVILATGGKSYPKTGSDGSGYSLALAYGHTLKKPLPALVGLHTQETWSQSVPGLSLKNVSLTLGAGKNKQSFFGEMLFTHQGISGPIVLQASRKIISLIDAGKKVEVSLDLKPALDQKKMQTRLIRELEEHAKKDIGNVLKHLLPQALVAPFLELSGLHLHDKCYEISKEKRLGLESLFKDLRLNISGHEGFKQAIITQGGINIKEINPSTMASKRMKGLYFAGEMIDIDASTGGYNLQIAFSSGFVAGKAASEERKDNESNCR